MSWRGCVQLLGCSSTTNQGFRRPFYYPQSLQIEFFNYFQIVVQFVHQRLTGRDFQAHDVFVGNAFDVFCQCAQGVAVCGDQDALAAQNSGGDLVFPERQYALQSNFQIFAVGYDIGGQVGIAAVVVCGERVFRVEQRRQGIVAAAPDVDLLVAVFFGGLFSCPNLAAGRSGVRSASSFLICGTNSWSDSSKTSCRF